ncbi:MAG: glutamate 5-kinase [Acidobacteriota bacterium]|nr:glutamate 5-kinase [Acidobacteriota bacterium]
MSFDLQNIRRVVIKVGSSLLIDEENQVREKWLRTVAKDINELRRQDIQVAVVTSGAVALGRKTLDYGNRILKLEEKQAAAACGQINLFSHWERAFQLENTNLHGAQILLTLDDSENRKRYLNARNTFETLLGCLNIVPIINENDTVATAELIVGDNDRLAARVAQMISADLLFLFSDVDGLYTANPAVDSTAVHIPELRQITAEIEAMAGGTGSPFGSGGMRTKIEAARIALAAGCDMIIGKGFEPHPIQRILSGERQTRFRASASPKSARKHWISGSLHSAGTIIVDDGARSALLRGNSLLPAGVRALQGVFERGDAVIIKDLQGRVLGKGLSAYSSADAERIIGFKSSEIERILGYKGRDTLIHRDDMALEICES